MTPILTRPSQLHHKNYDFEITNTFLKDLETFSISASLNFFPAFSIPHWKAGGKTKRLTESPLCKDHITQMALSKLSTHLDTPRRSYSRTPNANAHGISPHQNLERTTTCPQLAWPWKRHLILTETLWYIQSETNKFGPVADNHCYVDILTPPDLPQLWGTLFYFDVLSALWKTSPLLHSEQPFTKNVLSFW